MKKTKTFLKVMLKVFLFAILLLIVFQLARGFIVRLLEDAGYVWGYGWGPWDGRQRRSSLHCHGKKAEVYLMKKSEVFFLVLVSLIVFSLVFGDRIIDWVKSIITLVDPIDISWQSSGGFFDGKNEGFPEGNAEDSTHCYSLVLRAFSGVRETNYRMG